jgi:hypothetical protein
LSYEWTRASNDAPRFLKDVYPLQAYQLLLDRRTGEVVWQKNEPRFSIVKASEANVATMPSLERRSRGASAILGSFADAMSHRVALGFDFELAHDPMSRAPIADFILPAKKSWRAVLNDSGGERTGHLLT